MEINSIYNPSVSALGSTEAGFEAALNRPWDGKEQHCMPAFMGQEATSLLRLQVSQPLRRDNLSSELEAKMERLTSRLCDCR